MRWGECMRQEREGLRERTGARGHWCGWCWRRGSTVNVGTNCTVAGTGWPGVYVMIFVHRFHQKKALVGKTLPSAPMK
ncbi:hypothetical protein BDZ85DRAFT_268779 [Elsinoe ampelina]|uniref:Uncharacterized protein n=1 Tax=Elsinoe ampelina TaxID=302913 RepID=A0A6A6G0S8_9PEZI|nr:hypothetical protein BDZ85DRAFT_268779 [Elsinoe ampelina]